MITEAEWDRIFADMAATRAAAGLPRVVARAHHAQRVAEVPLPWTNALRDAGLLRVARSTSGTSVPKPWTAAIERRALEEQR